jgi:hypothetical protein
VSVVLLTEPFSGGGGGGGSGTVTSVDVVGGTTGLTTGGGPVTTAGVITLGGILNAASGGTGTATPALVAGTNVTITGTWPNQTINASGIGSSGPILESQIIISQNYTLTSNTNGLSIAPVTVSTGYAVTVPTGQVWVIWTI